MPKLTQHGFGPVEIVLVFLVLTVAVGAGWYVLRNRSFHQDKPFDRSIELHTMLYRTFESPDTAFTFSYPDLWTLQNNWANDKSITIKKTDNAHPFFVIKSGQKSETNNCDQSSLATSTTNEIKIAEVTGLQYYGEDSEGQIIITCFSQNSENMAFIYGYGHGQENLHLEEYQKLLESFSIEN